MTDVNQDPAKLAVFNSNAQSIAKEFVLDVEEVKAAYAQKPDSLSTLFNTMSEAKHRRNFHAGAAIVGGIITVASLPTIVVGLPVVPLAVAGYCGWRFQSKTNTLNAVKDTVKGQISTSKSASAPALTA
jgi:hypothetical protein